MPFESQSKEDKASPQSTKANAVEAPPFAADWGNPSVVYDSAFGDAGVEHEEEDLYERAAIPLPKPKNKTKAVPVRTDRAPTTEEILDADRPELSGASTEIVGDSTKELINEIYGLLSGSLPDIKSTLEKTAPPPSTPFALTLVKWAVEHVASLALGYIGGYVSEQLAKDPPKAVDAVVPPVLHKRASGRKKRDAARKFAKAKAEAAKADATAAPAPKTAAQQIVTKVADKNAPEAGKALAGRIDAAPTQAPIKGPRRAAPGGSLLDEFIAQQTAALAVGKVNAKTTLAMVLASAPHSGMVDLNAKLNALLDSATLQGWFAHKVTAEWLNCIARASLGPREGGQTTDMIGANTIDGIAAGGPAARQKWLGTTGFVDITLKVPNSVAGLKGVAIQSARIPSSFGASTILESLGDEVDARGVSYTLATMPVYRRIWIQTGSSKLTVAPAFVITPDGQIEADLTNPALAAIGRGAPVTLGEQSHIVGGSFSAADTLDENAWANRMIDSAHALQGAHMVRDMLRDVNPTVLK